MNKFQIISRLFLLLCLFSSCNSIKKNKINIGSVEIQYFKGFVETNIRVRCGSIKKNKNSFIVDTTLIEKYSEIVSRVRGLKILEFDSINCDIRIQCKINCENGDSINLCIGDFNCLMKDGKGVERDDSLIYLIRKYSGYYNYFSGHELTYFDELKQFGIPSNYKELRKKKKFNGIPLPPQ